MITVALLQLLPGKGWRENMEKGLRQCRIAKAMGADIALFPEMWNVGYQLPENPAEWDALAARRDGPFVRAFEALAKELGMAIAITYLEAYEPAPRNSVTVIDRFGRQALTYAKVHTCDFEIERHLTPGDGFPVCTLDTAAGPVRIGCMICYDREFPEAARILMLGGAELLLVPNACPMEQSRLSQLRARAYENMLGIATANYAYGQPDCNGHSSAFDGMAYRVPAPGASSGPRDTLVVEAGEMEGIYPAHFPIGTMRAYRAAEIHGNAFRHPRRYGPLVAEGIEAPFVREGYRP